MFKKPTKTNELQTSSGIELEKKEKQNERHASLKRSVNEEMEKKTKRVQTKDKEQQKESKNDRLLSFDPDEEDENADSD